jgi:UDP-glucose 4-epimerase
MVKKQEVNNLLIGGTGFIGSVLGQSLIAHGEKVVSVSNVSKGHSEGVTPMVIDLYQASCPQEVFDHADNTFILIGQIHKGFDADQEHQVLADLARGLKASQSRVFCFSTALVYGETPRPATESTPCEPIEEYSKFKLKAESLLQEHISSDRLTIFRLANIYGSTKNRGIIGVLMNKLMHPKPEITLNGDGQQRRDYVFIDYLIQAILAVAHKRHHGIVNISTGTSHSLIEVVDLASEISHQTIDCQVTQIPINEPQNSLVDNTRLKTVCKYSEFTPLRQGLAKTLKRYQEDSA